MNSTGEFARIMREVFALDSKWVDWFMRDVFRENELHFCDVDNRPAAVMLSTPYDFDFQGRNVTCAYISCVATVPNQRGKGLMRSLMHDTIVSAWTEGIPFASLIPASRPLYFIYDRMGFATVFYIDEERYTALHKFEKGDYRSVEPAYELFHRLEMQRQGAIRHNESQFRNSLADVGLSNGFAVAVDNGAGSEAIAFAEVGDEIKVIELLSSDEQATEAVLADVRERGGDKPIVIMAMPGNETISLNARGMIRIVNAEAALKAIAESVPSLGMTIKIRDRFLPENDGIYTIKNGKCEKSANVSRKIDLDVSISVLAEILFSSGKIGELFNLPTRRPFISLMLD